MPNPLEPSSRRRACVVTTLVGGLLAVTGAVAVGVALAGQQPAPPTSPPTAVPMNQTAPKASEQPAAEHGHSAQTLGYSEPVRLRIPSIDVSSPLVDLGLDDDGAMTTPQDPDRAGWFTPSPAPGVVGASVIAGHVTWNEDPSVFFKLAEVTKGDRVLVRRKDGITAVYEVTRTGTFPKIDFPTRAVYQPVDQPELRLITCGGGYDETTDDYLANVIVWAEMVRSR